MPLGDIENFIPKKHTVNVMILNYITVLNYIATHIWIDKQKINKRTGENMTTNKDFGEIYLERARYLLSGDDLLEQILEDLYNIIPTIQISEENDIRIEAEQALALA